MDWIDKLIANRKEVKELMAENELNKAKLAKLKKICNWFEANNAYIPQSIKDLVKDEDNQHK